jgi:spoIIIJ-associated protein
VGGGGGGSGARRAVEVSARTVDEAIVQALLRLGLSRDDVEVEVLSAGSPGRLLGFGAEPARVRVAPRATAGTRTAERESEAEPEDEAPDEDDQARVLGAAGRETPAAVAARGDTEAAGAPSEAAAAEAGEEGGEEEERSAETLEGEAEMARLILAELLRLMGIADASVEVVEIDPVTLNIRGPDVTDLIGRRGETLRAMQFVLGLMVNKQLRRRLRVHIDVDGYRARREELLRTMAQRFAYRVRSTREPMQLETMPPNERRIIHLALADDPDVFTESTGEGDSRRVVIKPRR